MLWGEITIERYPAYPSNFESLSRRISVDSRLSSLHSGIMLSRCPHNSILAGNGTMLEGETEVPIKKDDIHSSVAIFLTSSIKISRLPNSWTWKTYSRLRMYWNERRTSERCEQRWEYDRKRKVVGTRGWRVLKLIKLQVLALSPQCPRSCLQSYSPGLSIFRLYWIFLTYFKSSGPTHGPPHLRMLNSLFKDIWLFGFKFPSRFPVWVRFFCRHSKVHLGLFDRWCYLFDCSRRSTLIPEWRTAVPDFRPFTVNELLQWCCLIMVRLVSELDLFLSSSG